MLDEAVIEKILSKLALTYGVRFNDVYAGMDAGMVRRNWAKELGDVSREGIDYAFENLPEKFPPNVLEFRKLAQSRRTEASRLALPPPKPAGMNDEIRERIARIAKPNPDQKGWAKRLRARELACEPLTAHQRAMWRDALRVDVPKAEEAPRPACELVLNDGTSIALDPFAVLSIEPTSDPATGEARENVARVKALGDEWIVKGAPDVVRAHVMAAKRAAQLPKAKEKE